MNCLWISPGTVRKPGAMARKCAAQAARSMYDASLYWTIAVTIVRFPPADRRLFETPVFILPFRVSWGNQVAGSTDTRESLIRVAGAADRGVPHGVIRAGPLTDT